MTRHLGLFAKYWTPGEVKTRLNSVGPALASRIYHQFLDHQLTELRQVGDQRTIVFSPADRRDEFETISRGAWQLRPQSDGDLGQRLSNFFQNAISHSGNELADTQLDSLDSESPMSPHRVIVIGSDVPQLAPEQVEYAFEHLLTHEVVIGPSTDGGYYLIGMRQYNPQLFNGISWSTSSVLEQTIDRIRDLKIPYKLLPTMTDVDNPQDLQWLFDELKRTRQNRSARCLLDRLSFVPALGKMDG